MNTLENFSLPAGLPDIPPESKFRWNQGALAGQVVNYVALSQNAQGQWMVEFDRGGKVPATELYNMMTPVYESSGQSQQPTQQPQPTMGGMGNVDLSSLPASYRESLTNAMQNQQMAPERQDYLDRYEFPEGVDPNEVRQLSQGRRSRMAEGLGVSGDGVSPPVKQKSPIELLLDENEDFDAVDLVFKIKPNLPSKALVSVIIKSFKASGTKKEVIDYVMNRTQKILMDEVSANLVDVVCDHYGFDKDELEPKPEVVEESTDVEESVDSETEKPKT